MSPQILQLLPWVGILAVMYFLMIRPQQQQQKKRQSMLTTLKKGDKVVTIGGMHGIVEEMTDDIVVVRAGESKLTFNRSAIGTVRE